MERTSGNADWFNFSFHHGGKLMNHQWWFIWCYTLGETPLSLFFNVTDILLRLTINPLDILADNIKGAKHTCVNQTFRLAENVVTTTIKRLLTSLHGLLCCLALPVQTSFGPLLWKLGSNLARKEGTLVIVLQILFNLIFLSQIIHLEFIIRQQPTPFCSAGSDLLFRGCTSLVMAHPRGDQGVRGALCWLKRFQNVGCI